MVTIIPIVLKALLVVAAFGAGSVSHYLLKLPKNNCVEQAAEEMIKQETGFTIDFSSLDSEEDVK